MVYIEKFMEGEHQLMHKQLDEYQVKYEQGMRTKRMERRNIPTRMRRMRATASEGVRTVEEDAPGKNHGEDSQERVWTAQDSVPGAIADAARENEETSAQAGTL